MLRLLVVVVVLLLLSRTTGACLMALGVRETPAANGKTAVEFVHTQLLVFCDPGLSGTSKSCTGTECPGRLGGGWLASLPSLPLPPMLTAKELQWQ